MSPSLTEDPPPRGKIYGLRSFPGTDKSFTGAFTENARQLLREWGAAAECATSACGPNWRALLVDEKSGAVVPVFVVEECVRSSRTPYCDYCRCAGWSHHWVCKRRYHFIIPACEDWDNPLADDALRRTNHLLHGLIHCNGFGHLITLRGRDGGSTVLSGCDLMDIWDRLCSALRARAVTVEDIARKHSMDLRLLLGVAYGEPWFARWGYRFSKGCFGISETNYADAVDALSSLPVDSLQSRHVRRVVTTYRRLTGKPLVTVHELLRCLLEWKHLDPRTAKPVPPPSPLKLRVAKKRKQAYQDFDSLAKKQHTRWQIQRLQNVAEAAVDALLKRGPGKRMTRQELRDSVRGKIGDTGLIDFVIKLICDTIVGQHIVRRQPHPRTRVLEFFLEEVDESLKLLPGEDVKDCARQLSWPGMVEVERDVKAVYRAMVELRSEVAQTVLDCKHWVKRWDLGDEDDQLRYFVEWRPRPWEAMVLTRPMPPGEVVVVQPHASVGELMTKAGKALQDTYCIFEQFQSVGLDGVSGEDWEPVLVGGAQSGEVVGLHGDGADMRTELRYEGGADTWDVRCKCGARDDDGERLMACDACDVWVHTRCAGIDDRDTVPPLFLCEICGGALAAAGRKLEVMSD